MCVCDTDRESVGCLLGVRGPKQNLKQDFFLSKFVFCLKQIWNKPRLTREEKVKKQLICTGQ